MSEDQKSVISNEEVEAIVLELIKKHIEEVKIDEEEFLDLLKHSLSLNTMEKKRVIDAIPKTDSQPGLSQFQFDELRKVFLEEREKFKELAKEHPDDIKKLVYKQQTEWTQLGDILKMEEAQSEKGDEDEQKIDDIKANLGL